MVCFENLKNAIRFPAVGLNGNLSICLAKPGLFLSMKDELGFFDYPPQPGEAIFFRQTY